MRFAITQRIMLATAVSAAAALICVALWSRAGAEGPTPTPAGPASPAGEPTPLAPPSFATPGCRPAVGASPWPWAGTCGNHEFGQGTYVQPGRVAHVPEYRLRVDDVVELVYRRTHEETGTYRLNVGDRIKVELPPPPPPTNGTSAVAETVNREVIVQPDGDITLPYLGPVRAARLTFAELRDVLKTEYLRIYKRHLAQPTVTPVKIDAKLEDLINTVDSRYGAGGQVRVSRVTPDGTVALPAVGTVSVIGLTLEELKIELSQRYQAADVRGIEVQPVLQQRAPRFVYVLGEVQRPGRHTLEGPTTAIQAITVAGGVTGAASANLRQVVIFRRGEDWQLIATMLDLYDPIIHGAACSPVNDLWVADADIVVVPKTKILVFDEFVNLIFTRGVYGVVPFQGVSVGFAKASTL